MGGAIPFAFELRAAHFSDVSIDAAIFESTDAPSVDVEAGLSEDLTFPAGFRDILPPEITSSGRHRAAQTRFFIDNLPS
jgi:hypothetical protein